MTPKIPTWIVAVGALFVVRFATLSTSSFGWYHGFNEAVYTNIAWNYRTDIWTPRLDGAPFFDTGPFTTYLIWASHSFLGLSEASSRFAILLAYPIAVWAAYRAGEGFYGPGKGRIAGILVATMPFVLLWFGRAQTDAWMVTGILIFLAGYANPTGKAGAACIIGGLALGILSKQPALFLVPFAVVLAMPEKDSVESVWQKWRTVFLVLIGTVLGCLWYFVQALRFPAEYMSSTHFHTSSRVASFGENAPWAVTALIVGSGVLLFFSFLSRKRDHPFNDKKSILFLSVFAYSVFVIFDSPIGHEYYALPAIAILAVMAANWKWNTVTLIACVILNLLFAVAVMAYTGDLNDTSTRQVGFLLSTIPEGEQIIAPDRLVPQLELYSGRNVLYEEEANFTASRWVVAWDGGQVVDTDLTCQFAYESTKPLLHGPLRVWYCPASQVMT